MNNLSVRVSRFCRDFLKRTTYGECKGFCPFNGNPFKCSDAYIKEHPEEVEKILSQYEERRAAHNLESYVDLEEQAKKNNIVMNRVIDFIMEG